MLGIVSYGAYVPWFRLSRDTIAKAWGGRSIGGERSIANYDEDSITMAVEASFNCVKEIDHQSVDGLFFASTTSPYQEKQCSSLISAAVDLPSEIITSDFANSLRAGTSALRAAYNAVKSLSAKNVLVTASDCRLGFPQSEQEQSFGDGAAAILLGSSSVIATIEDAYSVSDEITDVWRTDRDNFVHSWEERWVLTQGYAKSMERAISGIMKRQGLKPNDLAKVILYAPEVRSQRDLAGRLGFDLKSQLQDPLLTGVGNTGAAHPLLMLAAALDEAGPGERMLLASYGQGSDAIILQVTEGIKERQPKPRVKDLLAAKRMLPSYEKYLSYRQLIEQAPELFNIDSAATTMWRTHRWALNLHGSKCRRCNLVSFPIQRVCYGCQAKDDFEEVKLSDKAGKVFTFSLDHLAGGPDSPSVQTIVESAEGNARIYCLMTDCEPGEVKIGMPVEMTFRRFREARGFYNYFWKCRMIR